MLVGLGPWGPPSPSGDHTPWSALPLSHSLHNTLAGPQQVSVSSVVLKDCPTVNLLKSKLVSHNYGISESQLWLSES